jgi:hypothetical protein
MPAERLSIRKVREVLRLKYACGASERVIARSVRIARTAIGNTSAAPLTAGGDRHPDRRGDRSHRNYRLSADSGTTCHRIDQARHGRLLAKESQGK